MSAPTPLNVVALISGGKDSIFSLIHCIANGHRVVALANLHPEEAASSNGTSSGGGSGSSTKADGEGCEEGSRDDVEDIDSFMYQTVGHGIIPLYQEALQLPLYRQPIAGGATVSSVNYRPPAPDLVSPDQQTEKTLTGSNLDDQLDETESLVPLLKRVLAAHPEVNAICTGAVLSNYQRTRIESVASRLGLTSLSYLWQYPSLPPAYTSSSLLDAMHSVGLEARIVKVASGGLDESCLWTDVVGQGRARVVNGVSRFSGPGGESGGAVIGEGGEFETIAIDGPNEVWKGGKIEVEVGETVHGEGGTALVKLKNGRVVPKQDDGKSINNLTKPEIFDSEFSSILSSFCATSTEADPLSRPTPSPPPSLPFHPPPTSIHIIDNTAYISNISCGQKQMRTAGAAEQMRHIVSYVDLLFSSPLSFAAPTASSIIHTTLLLREMSDFAAVNQEYSKMFLEPLPPSRVTVACAKSLPAGCRVLLSAVVDLSVDPKDGGTGRGTDPEAASFERKKSGLHVQSRSYWAPANIGPYSQAKSQQLRPRLKVLWTREKGTQVVYKGHRRCDASCSSMDRPGSEQSDSFGSPPDLIWFAGQIPLNPRSMTIYQPPTKGQDKSLDTVIESPKLPIGATRGDHASPFVHQAALSLQHLFRVGRAVEARTLLYGLAYIPHTESASEAQNRAREAVQVWTKVYRELWGCYQASTLEEGAAGEEEGEGEGENDDPDAWDLKYGHARMAGLTLNATSKTHLPSFPSFSHLSHLATLPKDSHPTDFWNQIIPPIFVAQVAQLPASAPVEWSGVGLSRNEKLITTTVSTTSDTLNLSCYRVHVSFIPNSQKLVLSWTIPTLENSGGLSEGKVASPEKDHDWDCEDDGNCKAGRTQLESDSILRDARSDACPLTQSPFHPISTSAILQTVQQVISSLAIPNRHNISLHGLQATVLTRALVEVRDEEEEEEEEETHRGIGPKLGVGVQVIPCESVYNDRGDFVAAAVIAQASLGLGPDDAPSSTA